MSRDEWTDVFKSSQKASVRKREVGESCWTGEWRRRRSSLGLDEVIGNWSGSEPWLNINKVLEGDDNDVVSMMRKGRVAVWLDGEATMRCTGAEPTHTLSPQKLFNSPHTKTFEEGTQEDKDMLSTNPLQYAQSRVSIPRKPPTLWAREARLLHHKQSKPLHRGAGGLLSRGMCSSNPLIYPPSWRPAVLISVSVDSISTTLHTMHGDVEPLWVSVSCYACAGGKAQKVCETFWTSFHSGPFRPDAEEYDSRKEPKSCLLHIPHSVYAEGVPCYLVLKVQRLLTGDDYNAITEIYKATKVRTGDAEKMRSKAQEIAEKTWVTRTELGWSVLPLCGGDVAWGDGMERAVSTAGMWRSRGTVPVDQCFACHFDEDKRKLEKINVSIDLRMEQIRPEHVHPLSLSPTANTLGNRSVRHCYVSGSIMTACAPQLPLVPLPPQQFRNDLYLRVNGLSLFKPKIRSDTDIRTFIVEILLRTKPNTHAPPVPQCMIDKDGRGLVSRQYTAVSFHQKDPSFDDEVSVILPEDLHPDLHVFVTIYHISFKRSKQSPLILVGHAFLPLTPNGYLIKESHHELPVLSAGCDAYSRIHEGSENYDSIYNERKEKDFCDNGKPCLSLSVLPVSTLHPNQSTSSERLATLLTWLPHAVRCKDGSHMDALPEMINSIGDIEVDEILRFFTVVVNFLLALLCTTESEAVLDSILTILCRVASADPGSIAWYCDTVFNNEMVPGCGEHQLWKHLLAVLSSCLKNRRIWGGLAYKDVHRYVFQLVLRSLLLTAPVPDDAVNSFRSMGVAFAEACNMTSLPPVVCATWGETIADLVGILRGEDAIKVLTLQVHSCKDMVACAATIQAFVARVPNPLPLIHGIADIVMRISEQLNTQNNRAGILEVIGECISTVTGCSTFTTQQFEYATTLFVPLLPKLLATWRCVKEEAKREKSRLTIAIKTYKDQISSMRKFAQSTADHFNGQRTQEFREETTTIAMTIVAKQTALADLEEKLDVVLKGEESELRSIGLLILGIIEGGEQWSKGTVAEDEAQQVFSLLAEIAGVLCVTGRDASVEWATQLAEHAAMVVLNTCIVHRSSEVAGHIIHTLHLLTMSNSCQKVTEAAMGLALHTVDHDTSGRVWAEVVMVVDIILTVLRGNSSMVQHGVAAMAAILKLASRSSKGAVLSMVLLNRLCQITDIEESTLVAVGVAAEGTLQLEGGKEVEVQWVTRNMLNLMKNRKELLSDAVISSREENGKYVFNVAKVLFGAYSLEEGIVWMGKLIDTHKFHFDSQEACRTHIAVAALLLDISQGLNDASKPAFPQTIHDLLPHESLYALVPYFRTVVTPDHVAYYVQYLHQTFKPSLVDVVDHLRQAVDLFTRVCNFDAAATLKEMVSAVEAENDMVAEAAPTRTSLRRASKLTTPSPERYFYVSARVQGEEERYVARATCGFDDDDSMYQPSRAQALSLPVRMGTLLPEEENVFCSIPVDQCEAEDGRGLFQALAEQQPSEGLRLMCYKTVSPMPSILATLPVVEEHEEWRTERCCVALDLTSLESRLEVMETCVRSQLSDSLSSPTIDSIDSSVCLARASNLLTSTQQLARKFDTDKLEERVREFLADVNYRTPTEPPEVCSRDTVIKDMTSVQIVAVVDALIKRLQSILVFVDESKSSCDMLCSEEKLQELAKLKDRTSSLVKPWQGIVSGLDCVYTS
eukprot:TRINITY_DN18828_c0_g1_i1.p1 TRINITY_DN18828_c0_g1~~TRINITY_DN18828_c0_g1_i1.p1  ORF type:complete len:1700 (+),score=530.72 TRINITY_DN18828_c0_g1_i1:31-5100(+)